MKILVAHPLPATALEDIRSLGSEVTYEPDLRRDALAARLRDAAILIVGPQRVAPEMIAGAHALQLIVRAGPDPANIAIEEASAGGVFVANCPDKDAVAIAELTLGLLLALDRRIVENTIALREGQWRRGEFLDAPGLAGRVLGILGDSEAGRHVIQRAKAFGMQVAVWSPTLTPEAAARREVEFCNWPRELARRCDVVCVHVRSDKEPVRLVDDDFLDSMREGAYLICAEQSGSVDEAALRRAIERRGLHVALDTYANEPAGDSGRFRNHLFELPGVIGTQHIGAETAQAREATARAVVSIVRTFLVSGEVRNCVNLCERSPATWQLVLRVRDQVGVMAAILDAVRADGINAEEISSRVFRGAKAAWCTIALDERPSTEALQAIRALDDVLHLDLRAVV